MQHHDVARDSNTIRRCQRIFVYTDKCFSSLLGILIGNYKDGVDNLSTCKTRNDCRTTIALRNVTTVLCAALSVV